MVEFKGEGIKHDLILPLDPLIPALLTPFTSKNEVDFQELYKLCDRQIANNIKQWVILGTTAETPTLTLEEQTDIINNLKNKYQADDSIIMIAGSGTNDTKTTIDKSLLFIELGIKCLLIVTPYYNKPNQRMLIKHFIDISFSIPENVYIILYNVQSRTGVELTAESLNYIVKNCNNNIIGIKNCGSIEASTELYNKGPKVNNRGYKFMYYSGDDDLWPELVPVGYHGVISVVYQSLSKPFFNCYEGIKNGKNITDYEEFKKLLEYIYSEPNPVGIKALNAYLSSASDHVRPPLLPFDSSYRKVFDKLITNNML